ncbi:MAG: hypothetical protein KBS83_04775 [Lachnospiraceae bacterium]|nr:hypothetical protein [Candidatus Equihabitans merdae]
MKKWDEYFIRLPHYVVQTNRKQLKDLKQILCNIILENALLIHFIISRETCHPRPEYGIVKEVMGYFPENVPDALAQMLYSS